MRNVDDRKDTDTINFRQRRLNLQTEKTRTIKIRQKIELVVVRREVEKEEKVAKEVYYHSCVV